MKNASVNSKPIKGIREEITYYCGFIGNKLSKYSDTTRNSVEHAINNIIFQADRGFYEANCNKNMHHMGPSTSHGYPNYSTASYSQPNVPYLNVSNSFDLLGNNHASQLSLQQQQQPRYTQHSLSTTHTAQPIHISIEPEQSPAPHSYVSACSSGPTHSQNSAVSSDFEESSNTQDDVSELEELI